jgi:hypothetical protein
VAAQAEGSIHFNAPVLLANALAAFALNLVSNSVLQLAAGSLTLIIIIKLPN